MLSSCAAHFSGMERLGKFPNWRDLSPILLVSDYSGEHPKSKYDVYTFVVTTLSTWQRLDPTRRQWRERHLTGRGALSFKGLGDSQRFGSLQSFLDQIVWRLPSLVFTVAIAKGHGPLFDSLPEESLALERWKPSVRERMLRVLHFASMLVAGFTRPRQDAMWFTDQDKLASNSGQLTALTELVANATTHLASANFGHLKVGTTASDNGSFELEDLASVADLTAGAVCEMLNSGLSTQLVGPLVVPAPSQVSHKTKLIAASFQRRDSASRHAFMVLEDSVNSVKWLKFHHRYGG